MVGLLERSGSYEQPFQGRSASLRTQGRPGFADAARANPGLLYNRFAVENRWLPIPLSPFRGCNNHGFRLAGTTVLSSAGPLTFVVMPLVLWKAVLQAQPAGSLEMLFLEEEGNAP